MKQQYLDNILMIERLHRCFLDMVKTHLDILKIDDISNVQTLILYNIADEELTVSELTQRGYYLGSNVSYNVKKMVEAGYLQQKQAIHDKRSTKVSVTTKGLAICAVMDKFFDENTAHLTRKGVAPKHLEELGNHLSSLERFWESTLLEMRRSL